MYLLRDGVALADCIIRAANPEETVLEIITCPGCGKPLQLPSDWLGTTTTCPHCKCYFNAPTKKADGTLTEPYLLRRNPFAQSRTVLPGLLLVMFSLFTLFINSVQMVRTFADLEQFAQRTKEDFEQQAKQREKEEDKQAMLDLIPVTIKWLPWLRVVFVLMSLVSLAGGIALIRRRNHVLALFGSFLALFHVANYCCFGGIPVGAYALFVLFNPQVRAEFNRNVTTEK
jgi:hypothetical protein